MREPTTNSIHMWRLERESNPGHIGVRRALSPLHHPPSSSSNHDGNAYEDVIWKSTFAELWLFCNCSITSEFFKVGKVKYPTNGPQGAPFKQILRIKTFYFMLTDVVVKTTNVIISRCCFAEDGTEFWSLVHAIRAAPLFFLIPPITFFVSGVVIDGYGRNRGIKQRHSLLRSEERFSYRTCGTYLIALYTCGTRTRTFFRRTLQNKKWKN